jgi:outer membrane protein OmpA-like peptidoglycan-associated protein
MRISRCNLFKASGLGLLAFSFSFYTYAQELKSLSGANSPQDDTNPVWIGNNTLLFTRAFHPSNLGGVVDPGDIWMTRKGENGQWEHAIHRPDLSSKGYDVPLGLEDVLTLLVYRMENGLGGIHQYSKLGTEWNYLRKLNTVDLEELQGLVTGRVVAGGKQIFLSGKSKLGFGNEDIYVIEKTGVIDWGPLLNLGNTINGIGQEMGPYFDSTDQLLYFSSNSHPGASGKDIWIAKKLGETWDTWSKPEKWEQISSAGSEGSLTFVDKNEVVWTSTQNSDGFADLMTFSTPIPLVLPTEFQIPNASQIQVKKPRETSEPAQVNNESNRIKAIPLSDSTKVYLTLPPIRPLEETDEASETPLFWIVIDPKNTIELAYQLNWQKKSGEYAEAKNNLTQREIIESDFRAVKVSSPGFFPLILQVGELNFGDKNIVLLTKAEPGNTVLLEKVNFKRGTAELEGEETEAVLTNLAHFLLENPQIKLRINGHTDNAGDPGLNKQLSLERASSVRDFLVKKGVNFENLRISGWGGTRPIASNATESGKSKNRRVELTVEN